MNSELGWDVLSNTRALPTEGLPTAHALPTEGLPAMVAALDEFLSSRAELTRPRSAVSEGKDLHRTRVSRE